MKIKVISNPFGGTSGLPVSPWVGKILEFNLVLDLNDRLYQVFNYKDLPINLKSVMVPAEYALSVLAKDNNCQEVVECYRQIFSQEFMESGYFNFICIIDGVEIIKILD